MIEDLAGLELASETRDRLHLCGGLTLRRAWPRSPEHLLLEYVDGEGRIVPGQWMADAHRLEEIARETAHRCPRTPSAIDGNGHVLLQPRGADRRLVGLCGLLLRSGSALLAHRPERRAVARLNGTAGVRFAKVVRPSRLGGLVAPSRWLAAVANRPVALPEILELDQSRGVVIWSKLPGLSLHELLDNETRLIPAARAAGKLLRWLHAVAPEGTTVHDAAAEIGMLKGQLERLRALEEPAWHRVRNASARVFEALGSGGPSPCLIHRDFYDKQVFVDEGDRCGLLDLDTMALGEPALDVANMLVHFELRALQQRCPTDVAERAASSFLEGYEPAPPVSSRIGAYRQAGYLRLACLYAYRPQWRHLSSQLADRIASPEPRR